jgi:hypothetical protein
MAATKKAAVPEHKLQASAGPAPGDMPTDRMIAALPLPVSVAHAIPELDVFIADHERAAQAIGQVVTAISYPDATPRLHVGVYSGFPITAGELQATYSDGSVHP